MINETVPAPAPGPPGTTDHHWAIPPNPQTCKVPGAKGEAARRRRQEADDALAHEITVLHVASKHTYGAPRIHAELARLGHRVNRKRVERIMRERGIAGVTRRRRRSLTRPAKRAVPAPDLIGRDFTAPGRAQARVGETDIRSSGGLLPDAGGRELLAFLSPDAPVRSRMVSEPPSLNSAVLSSSCLTMAMAASPASKPPFPSRSTGRGTRQTDRPKRVPRVPPVPHADQVRERTLKMLAAFAYIALVAGTVVYFHGDLEEADKRASVLAALVGLLSVPPAFQALWRMWRGNGTVESANVALPGVAGELAVAVLNQWNAEAVVRRVNAPYPLPVAWKAADEELTVSWAELGEMAHAWPGGPPGDPASWPQTAAGLSGQDSEIGEVFAERIPTRRLVILGEPGAGKSVLLIRLLQDILARRADDGPVPVLLSLASWDPSRPLNSWMADQLRRHYPGLRATTMASVGGRAGDLAGALVENGLILPLLDGFDELPEHLHAVALDKLNRALPAGRPLVLTARSAAYRAALDSPWRTPHLLGAAAVQLLPLDPGRTAAYLRSDAGGRHTTAAARWGRVVEHLGTDSPVGQALSTPLGLFLARTIYNPGPTGDHGQPPPHPDELCDRQRFPDRATVDRHLFRSFVPAAYAPDGPRPPRWNAAQAQQALTSLARFQETRRRGSPDLAWWELRKAVPVVIQCLLGGLMFFLVWALAPIGGDSTDLPKLLGPVTSGAVGAVLGRRIYGRAVITFLFGLIGVAVGGVLFSVAEYAMVDLLFGSYFYDPRGMQSLYARWILESGSTGFLHGFLIFFLAKYFLTPTADRQQVRQVITGGLWGAAAVIVAAASWISFNESLLDAFIAGFYGCLAGEFIGRKVRRQSGGIALGFAGGAASTLTLAFWHPSPWSFMHGDPMTMNFLVGTAGGIAFVLIWGGRARLIPRTPVATPSMGSFKLFTADRRAFFFTFAFFAPIAGITFGMTIGSLAGEYLSFYSAASVDLFDRSIIGVTTGVAAALAIGSASTIWPNFTVIRIYLAIRHKTPWNLMKFLQDAHEYRGVLRQVGPFYQFRHIDLQRHLAQES